MASFFDDEAEVGTTDEEDEMENDSKSIKVSKIGKKSQIVMCSNVAYSASSFFSFSLYFIIEE